MHVFDSVYRRMIKAFVFDVMFGQKRVDIHNFRSLLCSEIIDYTPQTENGNKLNGIGVFVSEEFIFCQVNFFSKSRFPFYNSNTKKLQLGRLKRMNIRKLPKMPQ
jgi:hypothetical protein